jgi:hypothetical protein
MHVMQHEGGREALNTARGAMVGGATPEGFKLGIHSLERELGMRY